MTKADPLDVVGSVFYFAFVGGTKIDTKRRVSGAFPRRQMHNLHRIVHDSGLAYAIFNRWAGPIGFRAGRLAALCKPVIRWLLNWFVHGR